MVQLMKPLQCFTCIIILNIISSVDGYDAILNIEHTAEMKKYSVMKFGANSVWIDMAGSMILNGELIEDRSFRRGIDYNSLDPNNKAYIVSNDGDNTLRKNYNGYAILNRTSTLYPLNIFKKLIAPIIANNEYTLSFSILTDTLPSNSIIDIVLWDHLITNVLASTTNIITNTNGVWTRYSVPMIPTSNEYELFPQLMLSVGTSSPNAVGVLGLDEIRFSMTSATNSYPIIETNMINMMKDIGIKSLRWPGGFEVDTFEWKESINSLNERGEIKTSKGEYQTASYGLDEFMNLCETNNLIPYLQVNIIEDVQSAIDLIEYLIGDQSSTFGAMRTANGHSEPYNIKYVELGNEPNSNYKLNYSYSDSGKGYAILAYNAGNAILNKWSSIKGDTNDIYLISTTEMQFQSADWITIDADTVNLVRKWNNDVYNFSSYDILSVINGVNGHYYSFFGKQTSDIQSVFEYLMSGTQVMYEEIVNDISISTKSKSKFWISEYGTCIKNKTDDSILPHRLYDFQAGLNIANILMGILLNRDNIYYGAHIHNLVEEVGFGMLRRNKISGHWYLRPTGIVFKLLSKFANETVFDCNVSNQDSINIVVGDGSVPSGITYNRLKCIASDQYVAILNLNYNQSVNISIFVNIMNVKDLVEILEYYNNDLYANNEINMTNIQQIAYNTSYYQQTDTFGIINITVKPHSLVVVNIMYESVINYTTTSTSKPTIYPTSTPIRITTTSLQPSMYPSKAPIYTTATSMTQTVSTSYKTTEVIGDDGQSFTSQTVCLCIVFAVLYI